MYITSISDYIQAIKIYKSNYTYKFDLLFPPDTYLINNVPDFIFRGHGSQDYKLIPGFFRIEEVSKGKIQCVYLAQEANILNDFISEACRYIKNIPVNDLSSWLEIAQHFGVPTRLLDFTSNPLVALYFACIDKQNDDGVVWIIDKNAYFRQFFGINHTVDSNQSKMNVQKIVQDEILEPHWTNYGAPNCIQYPWIYNPFCQEERMALQSSVFMIWGANHNDFLSFVNEDQYMVLDGEIANETKGFINKVEIRAEHKKNIIKELSLCGVNEKFIYPGLDGIGKYVRSKYKT